MMKFLIQLLTYHDLFLYFHGDKINAACDLRALSRFKSCLNHFGLAIIVFMNFVNELFSVISGKWN